MTRGKEDQAKTALIQVWSRVFDGTVCAKPFFRIYLFNEFFVLLRSNGRAHGPKWRPNSRWPTIWRPRAVAHVFPISLQFCFIFEGRNFVSSKGSRRAGSDEEILPEESAEGQLARGMTGGRTLSSSSGNPPLMLWFRCDTDVLEDACDCSTCCSCAHCFSNRASSSSSCAISRR